MRYALALLFLTPSSAPIPIAVFPMNSQVPPVARVSESFQFIFSESTFSSGLGNISYTLDGAPTWLQLDSPGRTFSGTPTPADIGSKNFSLVANDRDGSTSMPVTLITSTDPGPGLGLDIASQLSNQGSFSTPDRLILAPSSLINIAFSRETFTNTNQDTVYYAICANNTPLPSWLHFDPAALSFSGTSPQLDTTGATSQIYGIHIIASDIVGFSGAVAGFEVIVESHVFTTKNVSHTLKALPGDVVSYSDILGDLTLDGSPVSAADLAQASALTPLWLSLNTSSLILSGTSPPDVASQNITVTVTDKYGDEVEAIVSIDASSQTSVKSAVGTSIGSASIQTDNPPAPTTSPNTSAEYPAEEHVAKRQWIVAAIIGPLALIVALFLFWCCSRRHRRRRRSDVGLIASVRNMRNPRSLSEKNPEKNPTQEYQVIRPQTPRRLGDAPFQSIVRPPPPRVELSKRLSRWRWSGLEIQRRHSQAIETSTIHPFDHATTMEKGKVTAAPTQSTRNLGLRAAHSWLSLSSDEADNPSPSPPRNRKRKRKGQSISTWAGSLNTFRRSGPFGYGHGRIIEPGPSSSAMSPFDFAAAQAQPYKLPGRGHGNGIPATAMSYIRRSWQKASQSSWTSTSGATTSTGSRIRMPGSQKSQDLTYVMGREWPRPPTTTTMASRAFGHGTSNASNTEMEDDITGERRSTIRLVGYSAASDDLTPPSKQAYIKQRARKRNRENALFAAGPSARLSSLSKIGRPRMMVPKAVSRQSVSSAYSQPLEEEGSVRRKSTQQAVFPSPLKSPSQDSPPKIPLPCSTGTSRASSPTRSKSKFGTTAAARAFLAKRSLSRLRNRRNSAASSAAASPERHQDDDDDDATIIHEREQADRHRRQHPPSLSSTLALPPNPFGPASSSFPQRESFSHVPNDFSDLMERSSEAATDEEDRNQINQQPATNEEIQESVVRIGDRRRKSVVVEGQRQQQGSMRWLGELGTEGKEQDEEERKRDVKEDEEEYDDDDDDGKRESVFL